MVAAGTLVLTVAGWSLIGSRVRTFYITVVSKKDRQMSETMIEHRNLLNSLTFLKDFSVLAHDITYYLIITLYLKPEVILPS